VLDWAVATVGKLVEFHGGKLSPLGRENPNQAAVPHVLLVDLLVRTADRPRGDL
jgi:hypothetical protein